jgi:hypothetical protein
MLKKLITILVCVISLASCQMRAKAGDASHDTKNVRLYKHLSNSTVALVKPKCVAKNTSGECINVQRIYCTGVWISRSHILTAHHCVQSFVTSQSTDEEIENNEDEKLVNKSILFLNRSQVPHELRRGYVERPNANVATIVKFDVQNDLALIKAKKQDYSEHFVQISGEKLNVGQEIHVVGHTTGIPYTYAFGHISGIRVDYLQTGLMHVIQVSAPTYFGNSGGGAFTSDGKLVGICSYLYRSAPMHLNFFVHRDSIIDFLENRSPTSIRIKQ